MGKGMSKVYCGWCKHFDRGHRLCTHPGNAEEEHTAIGVLRVQPLVEKVNGDNNCGLYQYSWLRRWFL